MIKAKFKLVLAAALCTSFLVTPLLTENASAADNKSYQDKFLELREKISDPSSGYYREMDNGLKIPYHSRETFLCEGPDYGHETTSETYSYYVWLEAMYGKFSGDWTEFNKAWDSLETYMIPGEKDQPNMSWYNGNKPADYADEFLSTSKYPSPSVQNSGKVGKEGLSKELSKEYGTDDMYGMHWLLDTDNWYKYGTHGIPDGDGKLNKTGDSGYVQDDQPVFINTYQRGPHESAFKTVTHPSWDDIKTYGEQGKTGFLGLFNGSDTHQWRYTIASDADARAIQATYWADKWSKDAKKGDVSKDVSRASKLGDYLRFSMYDKYFRPIGIGANKNSGENKHYLLGWYYSWGADTDLENWGDPGSWAWKIGCSHNHFGYQNPMAAWVLSNDDSSDDTSDFTSPTANGKSDWKKSLDRQVELYQWLQSNDGAIAGGCTNSYTTDNGSYQNYPAGASTFYGMVYDEAPVYLDPPSNRWFGMQVWSLQRLAEYYNETGDKRAESVLNKWAKWAMSETTFTSDGYKMPANLKWSGQPGTWNESTKSSDNKGLGVSVESYTNADIGVAGSYANTLFYIAKGNEKYGDKELAATTKKTGEQLLDVMWNNYSDQYGIAKSEEIDPANYFDSEVFVPSGFKGVMGRGETVKPGIKFIDIRSGYTEDPDYARIKEAHDNGQKADMTYHRYWSQVDAALAYGTHAVLWPSGNPGDINGDGDINVADYSLFRKYFNAGGKAGNIKIHEENADVNEDGTVDFFDLVALKALI